MHDLTKGSLARNLLQTTSFMLVGMVFQTLYFLVDLYFVGRLGKSAVAAVSLSGNLMFLVLAVTQMLGVGTTAAHRARHRAQGPRRGAPHLQPVAGAVAGRGRAFFVVMMALRGRFARGAVRRPGDGAAGARLPDLVRPGAGGAVRDGGDGGRRCAESATSSPG